MDLFTLQNKRYDRQTQSGNAILSKGNKHFRDELKGYLKRESDNKIKDFSLKDSRKDCLVQVADTVASAIAWGYKNNNHIYKNALSKRKINVWEFK